MSAAIVGWAHTPFGKQDAETVESLIVRVATDADAAMERARSVARTEGLLVGISAGAASGRPA